MATNDLLLLDSLISKASSRLGSSLTQDELFELFSLEQVLKECAVSADDLRVGWVDAGHDGGIDGFFTFVDERLATPDDVPVVQRTAPIIEVILCTVKHKNSFQQAPLDQLNNSISELLDLSKSEEELSYPYNDAVLEARAVLRQAIVEHADKRFRFRARIIYVSRGDSTNVGTDLRGRAALIEATVRERFRETEKASVEFIGATELLDLARRRPNFSLRLPFVEAPLSRGRTNYVLLCRLRDYFQFVSADDGGLRRYLFESNIRDYLGGHVGVNKDIASTISEGDVNDSVDFWWLNNGVTLLASHASPVGKEMHLENVQIVNGLQTTETIYQVFRSARESGRHEEIERDDRAVLVKIIISQESATLDRIIKASNFQTPVDPAYLRATDKIQRDIEQYLHDRDWYYERRNSYWQNHGKPIERIISPRVLAKFVRAILLGDPLGSLSSKSNVFRNDQIYRKIFNPKWSLAVFWAAVVIAKEIERLKLAAGVLPGTTDTKVSASVLPFASFVYVAQTLGRPSWGAEEVISVAESLDDARARAVVEAVRECVARMSVQRGIKARRAIRRKSFFTELLATSRLGSPEVDAELDADFKEAGD